MTCQTSPTKVDTMCILMFDIAAVHCCSTRTTDSFNKGLSPAIEMAECDCNDHGLCPGKIVWSCSKVPGDIITQGLPVLVRLSTASRSSPG